jgi:hypothetical protein
VEQTPPSSGKSKFDIVEKLMRKHEAMVKQVMKQKNHLASNFTTRAAKNKLRFSQNNLKGKTNDGSPANNFEDAKRAHQKAKAEIQGNSINNYMLNNL